jgi:hypothetical protein
MARRIAADRRLKIRDKQLISVIASGNKKAYLNQIHIDI